MADHLLAHLRNDDVVLDSLPDSLQAALQVRKRFLASLPPDSAGLEFVVADLQRWRPGSSVKVAFLGGSTELHGMIADATTAITDVCSLTLDFGRDSQTGQYRTWSEQDQNHSAEVRVSFDKAGYWSLVGTDSVDATIGAPGDDVGGRPRQRSLNLGGFTMARPSNWEGVVRHEFLHALAFHHEHQNMRGPCEQAFRWEDDFQYEPTQDADGRFVEDSAGRRPGIYTYLAGYPNFWPTAKVDHNLRTHEDPNTVAGPFDSASVMLYRFPTLFYRTNPSPCAPTGDGIRLSDGDIRGLRLLYGERPEDIESFATRTRDLATAIERKYPGVQTEALGRAVPSFAESAMKRIDRMLR